MKRLFATGLMIAGLAVSPAAAQTGAAASSAAEDTTTNNMSRQNGRDDGFDLGWLGLLGLAGLAGFRRKPTVVHRDSGVNRTGTDRI